VSGTKKGKEAPGSRRAPRDNAALRSFFDNLDFLPTEGAFVASDADRWRTAIYIVEQSGIADLLARWRAEDRGDKRPGPTPWLNETQVFTLFLILTLHRRPPLFTEMAAMLYHADQSLLDLLGVVKSDASETALFHRAYNTYHERLVPLLNPEPESLSRPTRLVAGTSGTATTTAARALRPPAEPRPDSSAPPTNWSGPGSSPCSRSAYPAFPASWSGRSWTNRARGSPRTP